MQPLINIIHNFDALLDYKLEYSYLGSERIMVNELQIREDILNSSPIYTNQSTKFDKNHIIPANTLKNGKSYRAKIRVQGHNGKWSVWSPEVSFTCLKTPRIVFQNLQEDKFVYNNDILFQAVFQQEQGDRVLDYQFVLLNSNKIPIIKYPVRLPETANPNLMQERVENIDKGKIYYIGVYVNTTNGLNYFDSHEFVAHYVAPATNGIVNASVDKDNGTVLVQAYLKQNLGIQVQPLRVSSEDEPLIPIDYTYLDGEKIIIPPHLPLTYTRLGMAEASDFVLKLWCENVKNGMFLEFEGENGDGIGLQLYKRNDCVVMKKEYLNEDGNGLRSIHRSNIIPNLGNSAFYLYLKVIEFRPEIVIQKI